MDQHLLDSWLALEGESVAAPAHGNSAGKILPGHAWFVREDDGDEEFMLIACERRAQLEPLLKHVAFNLRARSITVMIDDAPVPVVIVMLRISGGDESALFSAWIDEISPRTEGILENLAAQSQLLIALVDEEGHTVGTAMARNVLAFRMENLRGWITNLARTTPWTPPQFAAAKSYIRSQYPSNEDLWTRFDEDSADVNERELTAVPA